ncbi:hypothetical protein CS8_010940 [Cupriavidus sp. 8B]
MAAVAAAPATTRRRLKLAGGSATMAGGGSLDGKGGSLRKAGTIGGDIGGQKGPWRARRAQPGAEVL